LAVNFPFTERASEQAVLIAPPSSRLAITWRADCRRRPQARRDLGPVRAQELRVACEVVRPVAAEAALAFRA